MFLFHNLNSASALLLIVAVGVVGVLHTMVPDHWAPITLIAKQRGWTKAQTARAALGAGTGHVLSTLFLGLLVRLARNGGRTSPRTRARTWPCASSSRS